MVSELGRAESDALSVLESITKYYISRAKLISKVISHVSTKSVIYTMLNFICSRSNTLELKTTA